MYKPQVEAVHRARTFPVSGPFEGRRRQLLGFGYGRPFETSDGLLIFNAVLRQFWEMSWQKDASMLLLRLGAGGLMVPHGWGKLERLRTGLAEGEVQFYDWMGLGTEVSLGLAVFGELVAPAFIVLGLLTRWMSVPAAITMAVAAFGAHAGDPISDKEHALLFLAPFVVLALMGGGRYSLDHRIGRPK